MKSSKDVVGDAGIDPEHWLVRRPAGMGRAVLRFDAVGIVTFAECYKKTGTGTGEYHSPTQSNHVLLWVVREDARPGETVIGREMQALKSMPRHKNVGMIIWCSIGIPPPWLSKVGDAVHSKSAAGAGEPTGVGETKAGQDSQGPGESTSPASSAGASASKSDQAPFGCRHRACMLAMVLPPGRHVRELCKPARGLSPLELLLGGVGIAEGMLHLKQHGYPSLDLTLDYIMWWRPDAKRTGWIPVIVPFYPCGPGASSAGDAGEGDAEGKLDAPKPSHVQCLCRVLRDLASVRGVKVDKQMIDADGGQTPLYPTGNGSSASSGAGAGGGSSSSQDAAATSAVPDSCSRATGPALGQPPGWHALLSRLEEGADLQASMDISVALRELRMFLIDSMIPLLIKSLTRARSSAEIADIDDVIRAIQPDVACLMRALWHVWVHGNGIRSTDDMQEWVRDIFTGLLARVVLRLQTDCAAVDCLSQVLYQYSGSHVAAACILLVAPRYPPLKYALVAADASSRLAELARSEALDDVAIGLNALLQVTTGDSSCKERVLLSGVLPDLKKLMNHPNSNIAYVAIGCVQNLAVGEEGVVLQMVQEGILAALLRVIRTRQEPLIASAARAIRNIAGGSQACYQAIMDLQGLPDLVQLLDTRERQAADKRDETTAAIAAGALWSLSSGSVQIQEAVCSSGAIDGLVQLLKRGSESEKLEAAGALRNMASGTDAMTRQVAEAGVVPLLVQMLDSQSNDHLMIAASSLRNIAGGPVDLIKLVVRSGAVPKLLYLLGGDNTAVVIQALNALWCISSGPRSCAKALIKAGGAHLLERHQNSADAELSAVAKGVDLNLKVSGAMGKLAESPAFEQLREWMRNGTSKEAELGVSTLQSLSRISDKWRDRIALSGAVTDVVNLLSSEVDRGVEYAARCLIELANGTSTVLSVIQESGALLRLRRLEAAGSQVADAVQEAIASLSNKLAQSEENSSDDSESEGDGVRSEEESRGTQMDVPRSIVLDGGASAELQLQRRAHRSTVGSVSGQTESHQSNPSLRSHRTGYTWSTVTSRGGASLGAWHAVHTGSTCSSHIDAPHVCWASNHDVLPRVSSLGFARNSMQTTSVGSDKHLTDEDDRVSKPSQQARRLLAGSVVQQAESGSMQSASDGRESTRSVKFLFETAKHRQHASERCTLPETCPGAWRNQATSGPEHGWHNWTALCNLFRPLHRSIRRIRVRQNALQSGTAWRVPARSEASHIGRASVTTAPIGCETQTPASKPRIDPVYASRASSGGDSQASTFEGARSPATVRSGAPVATRTSSGGEVSVATANSSTRSASSVFQTMRASSTATRTGSIPGAPGQPREGGGSARTSASSDGESLVGEPSADGSPSQWPAVSSIAAGSTQPDPSPGWEVGSQQDGGGATHAAPLDLSDRPTGDDMRARAVAMGVATDSSVHSGSVASTDRTRTTSARSRGTGRTGASKASVGIGSQDPETGEMYTPEAWDLARAQAGYSY